MASGTFYPAASGDDCTIKNATDFYNSVEYLIAGNLSDSSVWDSCVRFLNVSIPQGAILTSAFVKFTAYDSQSEVTCNANCYFNDTDNAVAPTNSTEYNALAVTTAIAWGNIGAWVDGSQYDTPELKTILQNIVDRGGWASGQAVQFIIKNNSSSTSARRTASSFDYSSGTEKAELHVIWEVGTVVEISEDVNVTSEFGNNLGELNEDVNVNSEFACLVADAPISEDVSVNSEIIYFETDSPISEDVSVSAELISEYTGSLSEDASVNAEIDVTKNLFGALSEEASVNSEFVCYQRPANIDAELPMITADLLGGQGGFLDATLPCITADIKGGAQLDVTLPCITASIEGKAGIVGSLNVTLPMVTANIEGKAETLGDIDVTLPMIRAYITGKTGEVGSINVTLPMVEASLSGYQDISGDINVTLPLINPCLVGTVDRFDCTPLRYLEPI